jgi:hypothetical protein
LGGGGTEPGHQTGKSQFTEYLGYVMIGKKKVKIAQPATKTVTRVIRVPTPVKAPARQHEVYGFAGPQLPPPTARVPQTAQQQTDLVARQSMKKGFAAPIRATPIRVSRPPQSRMSQPKMSIPTATPFKVKRGKR